MTSNSPIAKCPDDILLTIFALNTVPPDRGSFRFSPLTRTRFASQVCSHWRQLVLDSSLLWGRLLDLNYLDQKGSQWRDEILLRTKQAYLHVKVILHPDRPQITSFFFKIIDKEWSRIQDLYVLQVSNCDDCDDDKWLPIHRPTDTLRSCYLSLNAKPLRSVNEPLFSHYAPSLRHLEIRRTIFELPSNWFQQLHSLHLSGQYHPLPFLLTFPRVSPLIQSLSVHGLENSNLDLDDSWPKIHFPLLQALRLGGHLAACFKILEHITIPDGCGFYLSTYDRMSPRFTSSIPQVISPFSERFHKYHTPISVSLNVYCDTFTYWSSPMSFESPTFLFSIRQDEQPPPISRCFEALLGCPFSQVENLTLKAEDGLLQQSNLKFLEFIALFSSIVKLSSALVVLQLLVEARDHTTSTIVLPALKVINPVADFDETVVQTITTFLDWRRAINVPIESLDLRGCQEFSDFRELERFSGLEVQWRTVNKEVKVYICGSGDAQHLDFTTPPVRDDDGELDSDNTH